MRKCVLITGGSRGIGRALVLAFSKAGYQVFFTYYNSPDLALDLEGKTGACGFSVNFENIAV